MASDWFLGVDPGRQGGWAVVSRAGNVSDVQPLPYLSDRIDSRKLFADWKPWAGSQTTAAIEHPLARTGESDTGHLRSGLNFGILIACATLHEMKLTLPMPHIWKQKMRLGKDKKMSIRLCDELFPDMYSHIRGPRGGMLDGLAEALLIAEFGRRQDLRLKSNEFGKVDVATEFAHAAPTKHTGAFDDWIAESVD